MNVTFIPNIYQESVEIVALESILEMIRSEKYKSEVDQIRSLVQTNKSSDGDEAKKRKRQLPLFKLAIVMQNKTEFSDTDIVTGLVQFDIDLADNPGIDAKGTISSLVSRLS